MFYEGKNYTEAVETYKNALHNQPSDERNEIQLCLGQKNVMENPLKTIG
jgi:hypothetical protein